MSIRPLLRAAACAAVLAAGCKDATGPRPEAPRTLAIDPDSARLALPGDTLRLRVAVRGERGSELTSVPLRWSSSDTTVAVVSADGLLRATGYGRAVVEVRADTLSARMDVAVGARGATSWTVARAPAATGTPLADVWAAPDGALFAVGAGGAAMRWDGTRWSRLATGTAEDLQGVGGTGSNDVYAVSAQGSVFRSTGGGWTRVDAGDRRALSAVWVAPTGEVFAVGSHTRAGFSPRGLVLRGDATGWSETPIEEGGLYIRLRGVWGTSANNVYAVGHYGARGAVFHYDGTSWKRLTMVPDLGLVPDYYGLNDVWGTSGSDVWVGGDESSVLHYDGTRWRQVAVPLRVYVRSVWGTSPTDVYAAGYSSTTGSTVVLRWDGTRFTRLDVPRPMQGFTEFAGAAASPSTGFVVGPDGTVLRYSGSGWETVQYGPELADVFAATDRSAVAVGSGASAFVYDGSGWSAAEPPSIGLPLSTVTGRGERDFLAANRNGAVFRFDGQSWTVVRENWNAGFADSWTAADGRTWFVENSFVPSFRQTPPSWGRNVVVYDGSTFRAAWSSPRSPSPVTLNGIWGGAGGQGYAVGSGGLVVRYDGSEWAPMPSGTTRDLYAVWGAGGAVFAVGEGGLILRLAGGSWTPVPSGTTATLRGVWGSAESDFYAVGDGGTLLRFDGRRWHSLESGTDVRLNAVSGAGGAVFAAGERGAIVVGR